MDVAEDGDAALDFVDATTYALIIRDGMLPLRAHSLHSWGGTRLAGLGLPTNAHALSSRGFATLAQDSYRNA